MWDVLIELKILSKNQVSYLSFLTLSKGKFDKPVIAKGNRAFSKSGLGEKNSISPSALSFAAIYRNGLGTNASYWSKLRSFFLFLFLYKGRLNSLNIQIGNKKILNAFLQMSLDLLSVLKYLPCIYNTMPKISFPHE